MTNFLENKVGFHIFLIALTHAEVPTTILRYNEWVPVYCYAVANVFRVVVLHVHFYVGTVCAIIRVISDCTDITLNKIKRSINMEVYLMWVIREMEKWLAVQPRQTQRALRNRKEKAVHLISTAPRRSTEIHNCFTHSHTQT